jgi:hypothetical protein
LAKKDAPDAISPEDFWERKTSEWRMDEQQFKMIQGLDSSNSGDRTLDVEYAFEPANEAYSLYISQNPTEGGQVAAVDATNVTPTYRFPFAMIYKIAKME